MIGGVVSGGLTYVTFRPMGRRLVDTMVKNLSGEFDDRLELNPAFVAIEDRGVDVEAKRPALEAE